MTMDQATRAAEWIGAEFDGVYAHVVDPSFAYPLYLDRWTAEMVRDALVSLSKQGGDVGSVLEDIDEWLRTGARPYLDGPEAEDAYQPINR